ncbi:MAG: flavohemoglobin expression-modulating QEGLA motif protein, partial [Dokdonella sp.]
MTSSGQPDFYAELDQRLVAATRGIRLLATVSWPASIELEFIAAWKRGVATLPEITYAHVDFSTTREALAEITQAADPAHPLGDYIRRTA